MTKPYTPDLPEDEPVILTIHPTAGVYLLRYIIWLMIVILLISKGYFGETLFDITFKTFASLIIFMAIEAWLFDEPFYWFKALRRRWYLTPFRIHFGSPEIDTVVDLYDVGSIKIWMAWGLRMYCKDGSRHKIDYVWGPRKLRDQILDARDKVKDLE